MIDKYLSKTVDEPTPTAMKIGLCIAGFPAVGGVLRATRDWHGPESVNVLGSAIGLGTSLAAFMCVVALWNLKRWAVFVLLVLFLFDTLLSVSHGAHWWFVVPLRFLPLLPVAFYWRRMTWT